MCLQEDRKPVFSLFNNSLSTPIPAQLGKFSQLPFRVASRNLPHDLIFMPHDKTKIQAYWVYINLNQ